jgi:Zn ribbon nucleic-acid-binding protein
MEIKLTHALKNNEIVRINQVEKGLACGCYCPACNAQLMAKKGEVKAHHFAHYNAVDCGYQKETELHYRAKKILEEATYINVPRHNLNNENQIEVSYQEFQYSGVVSEKKLGFIVPDIILFQNDQMVLVEIAVTHFIDEEKQAKINEMKLPVLEINLSSFEYDFDDLELREALLFGKGIKEWKYNDKLTKLIKTQKEIEKLKILELENLRIKNEKIENDKQTQIQKNENELKIFRDNNSRKINTKNVLNRKIYIVRSCPRNDVTQDKGYAVINTDCKKCSAYFETLMVESVIICTNH